MRGARDEVWPKVTLEDLISRADETAVFEAVLSEKQNRQLSGCLAIVVVEHSTQSLSLLDRTIQ